VKRVLFLIPILMLDACMKTTAIRPLRPLEIALAPYLDDASAQLTGSFMYEGDCLLFRDEESRKIYHAIWPVGTVFNGTSVIYHLPAKSDSRVVLAEQVQISGRPLEWSWLDAEYYAPFRQQCEFTPFFVSAVRPAN